MYDPAIGRWMSTDPYGQYDSPYIGMGNNPVSSVDPDGGFVDPEKPINDSKPNKLKEVEIRANRMTPDERMASRTARGLTGDALFRFSDGTEDWAAKNRVESYGQYRKTMSEQPEFEMWFINVVAWTSGAGELYEGGAALYSLGRFGLRKVLARGIVVEAETGVKQVSLQLTKSTTQLGQQMHKAYKIGDVVEGVAMKEFTGIPGIRPDFVDFSTRTIYELKPLNPRAIRQGLVQLDKYQQLMQKTYGGSWTKVLETY